MTAFLDLVGAEHAFGSTRVLGGVNLAIARGELVSLLGPSGCGKTTLLRIIAGLLRPDAGSVLLDGEDITRKPPHHRDVGVVFQSYALFPHLTVAENIAFGLEARKAPMADVRAAVDRFLDLVHMTEQRDRSVRMLSGGQQQRVAVARALAVKPKLLLLDEPFSALDRKLRETMQIELKRLLRELSITAVFVTHDQDEALMMSDRIAVMNRGAIEQLGTPGKIYHEPATAFVLGFVGLSSRIHGTVRSSAGGMVSLETRYGLLSAQGGAAVGTQAFLAIRPERMAVAVSGDGAQSFDAVLRDVVFQGSKVQIHFVTEGRDQLLVEGTELPKSGAAPGRRLAITFDPRDAKVFAEEATT